MAALTHTKLPETKIRAGRFSYPLAANFDGQIGGLVGIGPDASLVPWEDVADMDFVGILLDYEGSGLGLIGEAIPGTPYGRVNEHGDTIVHVVVAGTGPEIQSLVYGLTDNWETDLTVDGAAHTGPVGWICGGVAGDWEVRLFTPEEYRAFLSS